MATLKEIAKEVADEIRDGIAWVIIYKKGQSWEVLSVWSDLTTSDWEPDDLSEALEILRVDQEAVALNGYYLGHFGKMTFSDIAEGIRWHYENGTNLLADDETISQHYVEEERNRLYNRAVREQNAYRAWLLVQPPRKILDYAFEYAIREDMLQILEDIELEENQLEVLLKTDTPLGDITKRFSSRDYTNYKNVIEDTIIECTKEKILNNANDKDLTQ